jgi:hypothetical protein
MSSRLAHITLNGGNLRNSHLYLSDIMDLFPDDAVGGTNETTRSVRALEIHCGIGDPILSDIAVDKKIFRKRGWVAEFLRHINWWELMSLSLKKPAQADITYIHVALYMGIKDGHQLFLSPKD